MRSVLPGRISSGEIDIARIKIEATSRDDIPQILMGLQHIYVTESIKEPVFKILEDIIPYKQTDESKAVAVSSEMGRPGMAQWVILVLGVLRLCLNADYDRIRELANEHATLREMLGHVCDDKTSYCLQTLKDNLRLFTPALLQRISNEVIRGGYALLDIDIHQQLRGRCDSFVLKTDVHFPTDINLLYDAIRYLIHDCVKWGKQHPLSGWQKHAANLSKFKTLYRKIQKLKHSNSKDDEKKQAKEKQIHEAHEDYLKLAQFYLQRVQDSHQQLKDEYHIPELILGEARVFIQHAERQINQIRRRVIQGEVIPHEEKVFSLFQPHTEWISKGKAGVPVELGLRVAVVESWEGFILHHQVMEKQTDDRIVVDIIKETQAAFPRFSACSFDKGFYSPSNQIELGELLDHCTLPKKGKLSQADQSREYAEDFKAAKKRHSGVESAINALEVHGLDKCPDHGIEGFKRYTAMAVLSRNIQVLGAIKRNLERERLKEEKQAA